MGRLQFYLERRRVAACSSSRARATLTDDSRLLKAGSGPPIKIGKYLETIQQAFSNVEARDALPATINGLWKADLILGCTVADRWAAASVKINAAQLEAAQGIRIGIVPASRRHGDRVRHERGLIICPIPHDYAFMQKFYEAWRVVCAFLRADANVPPSVAVPSPAEWEVARVLTERREYPVRQVIEALAAFAQPELLTNDEPHIETVSVEHTTFWKRLLSRPASPGPLTSMPFLPEPRTVLAPMPLILN
jgi:hypothetical protein